MMLDCEHQQFLRPIDSLFAAYFALIPPCVWFAAVSIFAARDTDTRIIKTGHLCFNCRRDTFESDGRMDLSWHGSTSPARSTSLFYCRYVRSDTASDWVSTSAVVTAKAKCGNHRSRASDSGIVSSGGIAVRPIRYAVVRERMTDDGRILLAYLSALVCRVCAVPAGRCRQQCSNHAIRPAAPASRPANR